MKEYYKSLSDFFKSLMLFFAGISVALVAYMYKSNDFTLLPLSAFFGCVWLGVMFGLLCVYAMSRLKKYD